MKRVSIFTLALGLALLFFPGCQSNVVFPSITATPTGTYNTGHFVWRDLITRDPAAARQFYGSVFGWTFETTNTGKWDYTLIKHNGQPIGGIFPLPAGAAENSSAEWVSAISVSSVQNSVNAAVARGGTAVDKVTEVAGRGTSAILVDPQGAIVSLIHSPVGDPLDADPVMNGWLWTELWTTDPAGSKAFYESLTGGTAEQIKDEERDYWLMKVKGDEVAGIIRNPSPEMRSTWVPYIRVADPAAVAQKAKAAGGHILLDPSSGFRAGSVAVLSDPTGAPFIVQKWPM